MQKIQTFRYFLSLALCAICLTLNAQTGLKVQLSLTSNSPFISDWTTGNQAAVLTIINSGKEDREFKVASELFFDGTLVAKNDINKMSPTSLSAGATLTVNAEDFFPVSSVEYYGTFKVSDVIRTGKVPEGLYQLCTRLVDVKSGTDLTTAVCKTFNVRDYDLRVIAPADKTVLSVADVSKLSFKWIMNPKTPGVIYQLKLYEIPDGQGAQEAINTVPLYDAEVKNKESLLYPFDAPRLEGGKEYAFTISDKNDNGQPLTQKGRSDVYSFSVEGGVRIPSGGGADSMPPQPPMPPPPFGSCNFSCTPQTIIRCNPGTTISLPVPFGWGTFSCNPGTMTYSVNGTPHGTPPGSGYFPTSYFNVGCNMLTYKFSCACGQVRTCNYEICIFPTLTTSMDKAAVCKGDGAKLFINPTLPPGYDVDWYWADGPITGGTTWTLLGSGNGRNTNPIVPACPPGTSSVIRHFRAVITASSGLAPWPTICTVQPTQIQVDCPTQPGTITGPGATLCLTTNPQNIALNYSGGVGSIIKWIENATNINTTSSSITRSVGPGIWNYKVEVRNGVCPIAYAQYAIQTEAPFTGNITGCQPEVCPNDAVTLTTNIINPPAAGTAITWQYRINCMGPWINSSVTTPTQNTNPIGNQGPYAPPPTTSLCWRSIVTSLSGICGPETTAVCQINIIQPPCVPIITTTGILPKCPGAVRTLIASTPCGTGPFTYVWYLDGIQVGTGPTYQATNPGNYTVEVFNKNQCDSKMSMPFTVKDCTHIVNITGPCNVPPNTPVTLCATITSQPGGACSNIVSYSWSPAGSTPNNSCNTWNPGPGISTTYTLTITDGLGCTKTIPYTVKVCQQ